VGQDCSHLKAQLGLGVHFKFALVVLGKFLIFTGYWQEASISHPCGPFHYLLTSWQFISLRVRDEGGEERNGGRKGKKERRRENEVMPNIGFFLPYS
jgi:hypothetical protein